MTVYEMIQELAKFEPDMDVEINAVADGYETYATAREDCKDGDEIPAWVSFDENIGDFDIDEHKHFKGNKIVRISVEVK